MSTGTQHDEQNGRIDPAAQTPWRLGGTASAAMVNRTHRVVRERARTIEARKNTMRSLWVPLLVSAGLLGAVVFALWTVLDEYEVVPMGLPDSSQQIFVLLMWCIPISGAALAVMMFRRSGPRTGPGGAR